jgi:hypothetical protein
MPVAVRYIRNISTPESQFTVKPLIGSPLRKLLFCRINKTEYRFLYL